MKEGIILKHRLSKIILLFLIFFLSACQNTSSNNKLDVYVSVYPVYDLVQKIGQDKINLVQVMPNQVDAHHWQPSTQDIINLEKADLFIYHGAGFEHWIDTVLDSINNENLKTIETSKAITLLSSDQQVDPHTWLDINKAKKQMAYIKDSLIKADSANKDFYESNYQKYAKEFDALNKEYLNELSKVKNNDIVVNHQAFSYLASAYNLNQHALVGIETESEPSAKKIADMIKFIKANNISAIFYESEDTKKVINTIALETNTKKLLLTPIESLSKEQIDNNDDYLSLMKQNLANLIIALK